MTIALGLISYALLALVGLLMVGLTSSRDSSLETALSQIAVHVSSSYDSTLASPYELAYSHEGVASNQAGTNFQKYFTARVSATQSDSSKITNTTTNLHLITISVTSVSSPGVTNIIQTMAFRP